MEAPTSSSSRDEAIGSQPASSTLNQDIGIQVKDGTVHMRDFIYSPVLAEKDNACLSDPFLTNPEHDKERIQITKGGLLKDSYRWILDHCNFLQWRTNPGSPLLWIRGDPGKGKTMLLCGIIDELGRTPSEPAYFFCQATDERLNNATTVFRGLIYLLCIQHPELVHHVQIEYSQTGKGLFNNSNASTALSKILENVLSDPILKENILAIDGRMLERQAFPP